MPDYSVDSIPTFPDEIQGNSAEGFIVEQGMQGYGKYADFARPGERENTVDAPGAFIQGNNPANQVAAGKEMSGNTSFNPDEDRD